MDDERLEALRVAGLSNFEKVGEFNTKMRLPVAARAEGAALLSFRDFNYREAFINEELKELKEAQLARDISGVADALADLLYVIYGTAHYYGIPMDDVFSEVHASNMRKTLGRGSLRGDIDPVIKPPGWTPPDVAGVLLADRIAKRRRVEADIRNSSWDDTA